MRQRLWIRAAIVVVAGMLAPALAGVCLGQPPAGAVSAADADRLDKKIVEIARIGARTSAAPFQPDRARRTLVTEDETNAYLRFKIPGQLPVGLVDPHVTALGEGRVSATAIVDLDAARRANTKAGLDPTQWLTGRLAVSVTGLLKTRAGMATFALESASIAGIPMPRALLQQLVSHYTRSAEHPEGVGLDAQFVLPAGIREIEIQLHQAVIVQ
ncbi:MAG: hypothetical protein WCP29_06945 [Acidobacteriota bacterium]